MNSRGLLLNIHLVSDSNVHFLDIYVLLQMTKFTMKVMPSFGIVQTYILMVEVDKM